MKFNNIGLTVMAAGLATSLSACGSTPAAANNSGTSKPATTTKAGHAKNTSAKNYAVKKTWTSTGPTPHFPGVDPRLHKLFVSNLAAGTLTVLSTKTGSVQGTIHLGGTVHTVMVDTKTQRVYVTDIARGYLDVINAATDSVIKEIPVGAHLHGLAVSNRLHQAFVTDVAQSKLYVINTITNTVVNPSGLSVGPNPWGVAVDASTMTAYVANTGVTPTQTMNPAGDSLSVVNLSTMAVTKTIKVGPHPWNVAVDQKNGKVYVGVAGSGMVAVISNNVVVHDIAVGKSPHGLAIDPKRHLLFVNNSASNSVSVISTKTDSVASTISVGSQPQGVAAARNGTAYVVNQKSQSVSVLRPGRG